MEHTGEILDPVDELVKVSRIEVISFETLAHAPVTGNDRPSIAKRDGPLAGLGNFAFEGS